MLDRSICALRSLRPETEFDKNIFWFRDDLHQPYAISPMGMTTIQAHHAWGYHVAAEQTSLPPSKGGHVKIHAGRVYIGFALIEDAKEIAQREPAFGKLVAQCIEDWDAYYKKYIREVISNLDTLNGVDTDKLILPHLLEHLRRAERLNRRNWEIHFTLMYPADAVYFTFEAYCKKHGLEEKDLVIMLRGFDSIATQTDEELWTLTKFLEECGIRDIFEKTESEKLLESLSKTPEARPWMDKFHRFLSIYGNRVVAAHLDVSTPTWKEDPVPVLDTIKGYFARMDSGWDFYESKKDIRNQREKAIQDFGNKLASDEERKEFHGLLQAAQGVYAFQEDHGFYIDQGSTAALRNAIIVCGKRLYRRKLIENVDDVTYLTFSELVEIMEALAYNEKVAVYHYSALAPHLVRERKSQMKATGDVECPLTVGNVPEKMTDPIGIKVFGIIDDILHPKGEKTVEERLEGFPGCSGSYRGACTGGERLR